MYPESDQTHGVCHLRTAAKGSDRSFAAIWLSGRSADEGAFCFESITASELTGKFHTDFNEPSKKYVVGHRFLQSLI